MDIITSVIGAVPQAVVSIVAGLEEHPQGALLLTILLVAVAAIVWAWRGKG